MFLALSLYGYAQSIDKGKKTNTAKSGTIMNKKILIVYFSHTGENYAVGNITKGNTCIIAEMIAEATSGTLFEIKPVKEYPKTYLECVDVAKREKEAKARPAIKDDINVQNYDIIFIGYPNWWGDMPMAVYTFIEKHEWNGKTVIPFCTHEGSGLSNTPAYIAKACKGSNVGKGIAITGSTAQNSRNSARQLVQHWIKSLN
jgi:flavodoxin